MKSLKMVIPFPFITLALVLVLPCSGFCDTVEVLLSKRVKIFDSKKTRIVDQLLELATSYQIPMAIEAIYDPEAEPSSETIHMENTTVQKILREIVKRNPEYGVRVTDGVLHIFAQSIVSDPNNFLNLRIPEFQLNRKDLLSASTELKLKINMLLHPEKYAYGYSGGGGMGFEPNSGFDKRNITLEVKDLTVREILNRLILLNGNALWVVYFAPDRMMENENFFAQTSQLFPNRKDIKNFYWEFVPLRIIK